MTKQEILHSTDVFLVDLDGTTYYAGVAIDGVPQALERLRAMGKKIVFMSNSSGLTERSCVERLIKCGVYQPQDYVQTAAMTALSYLKRNCQGKRVQMFTCSAVKEEFVAEGGILVEENADVCYLATDWETLDWGKVVRFHKSLCNGAFYLLVQNDVSAPMTASGETSPAVGAWAAFFHASTGRIPDVDCGKPSKTAADEIVRRLGVPQERMCMVGDSFRSDIPFGVQNGMKTILVLTGEAKEADIATSPVKPDLVLPSLKDLVN